MQEDCRTPMAWAIRKVYAQGQEDETMLPLHLVNRSGDPVGLVRDRDYMIFYNIRGEREVELSLALTQPDFTAFPTNGLTVHMATMIQYDPRITQHVAFPPQERLSGVLGEAVSAAGLRQVRIAESEKAIHVTYFLNGKRREPFPGEEWEIIESNREVEDFDELPEMSVAQVADATIARLQDPSLALIVANFANMDVVGHIEDRPAVVRAIEAVDEQVGRVLRAALQAGVVALVTADHGTVEKWYYPDGAIDTGHTDSPVPFVVVGLDAELRQGGSLTDVAPTVLELLGIPAPPQMTGRCLLIHPAPGPRRVLLLIVDGWGLSADPAVSLLSEARIPSLKWLLGTFPHTALTASGPCVGMPEGTVGNSETGHLHLGAGRCVPSDRMRIAQAIADGSFAHNEAFLWAIQGAQRHGKALHLLGIISFYSSHGSVRYLEELLRLCAREGVAPVYVHGLLGRRGERPESGAVYVGNVERLCSELGVGQVVSVIGRHWALDREERWDRVEKAYRLLTRGEGMPVLAG